MSAVIFFSSQIFRTNRLLQEYLGEREVVDILEDFEDIARNIDVRDLLGQMKALLPRYYSISSSPVVVGTFSYQVNPRLGMPRE